MAGESGRGDDLAASLESSLTGQRQGFASLDELFEFLRRESAAALDVDDKEGGTKA